MSRDIRYFGPHREPAVLVEDVGELRTGMVVYMSPCRWCGARYHRSILLSSSVRPALKSPSGKVLVDCLAFEHVPWAHGRKSFIGAPTIAAGIVFAVIAEPPAKAESRTRRRKLVTS